MTATGKLFSEFLIGLNPKVKLPSGITFINPYRNEEVKSVLKSFAQTYYGGNQKRTLILGINPGRFGAGITGVPFTDPVALTEHCGISHSFSGKTELSSDFVYRMIGAFGGPELFYSKFLISSVCPLGFLKGNLNYNYYDSPELVRAVEPFIRQSLAEQMKMNVRSDIVISLGKKNALFLNRFNAEMKLFGDVVNLEHPRYIMQYKRKQLNSYIRDYLTVLSAC